MFQSPHRSLTLAFGVALLAGSCTSKSNTTGSSGELDNGLFHYRCVTNNDTACAQSSEPSFPEAIAVGGQFRLEYEPKGDNADGTIRSSNTGRISRVEDVFTVLVPGFTAMLAKDPAGDILDIKHVRGRTVADIKVRESGTLVLDALFIPLGNIERIWAVPFDDRDVELAGSLDYTWSVDDDTVIRLVTAANSSEVELEALGVGTTNLQVGHGDLMTTIPVTVEDGGGTATSTSTSTSGSDTDTSGSDTGTGTGTASGGAP